MSSGKSGKIYQQEIKERTNDYISERYFNISRIIIPFSKMFKSYKPTDIYSGSEKIPFKERDPEFKIILIQEFADFI